MSSCLLQCVEVARNVLATGEEGIFACCPQMSQKLGENLLSALILLESRNMEATEYLTSILSKCTLEVSKLPDAVADALQPISGKDVLM